MTPLESSQDTFLNLLRRLAPEEGINPSPWPGLNCYRAITPTSPRCVVYKPSLCIVAQGAKRARLGDESYTYDPFHYLVVSVSLPVQAEIFAASPEKPFLSLSMEIDTSTLTNLVLEMDAPKEQGTDTDPEGMQPGMQVSSLDESLNRALVRFLGALERPMDRRVLAPMAYREILYHVLSGDQGALLRSVVLRDSGSHRVARVIRYLQLNFDQSLDVPTIASAVGMSTSSLHHTFKEVTSLSPIQYLKQLRLHEARTLMLDQGCNAGEAAHRVGYGSPSQFSREFKRFFGATPTREIERFRAA